MSNNLAGLIGLALNILAFAGFIFVIIGIPSENFGVTLVTAIIYLVGALFAGTLLMTLGAILETLQKMEDS